MPLWYVLGLANRHQLCLGLKQETEMAVAHLWQFSQKMLTSCSSSWQRWKQNTNKSVLSQSIKKQYFETSLAVGGPAVKAQCSHCRGWVTALAGELRSCMLLQCGQNIYIYILRFHMSEIPSRNCFSKKFLHSLHQLVIIFYK